VISGTPSAAGTVNFTVQVTDSTSPTPQTATAALSLTVLPVESSNWSGYAVGNGPYTAVTGTFNVPTIHASSTNTDTSEWVGIDGATDASLIQAGINEPYDHTTNLYQVMAWWEILPAPETPIAMTVSPGASVTVTIGQGSGTLWAITLTDNTTHQSFTTDQSYTGPGTSAEWIVEAPEVNGNQSTLGGYTPDVTFSSLTMAGTENTLTDVIMVQNGMQVSTPSELTSNGFNVAYGDVAPPPP
jgi:hypothetical protein